MTIESFRIRLVTHAGALSIDIKSVRKHGHLVNHVAAETHAARDECSADYLINRRRYTVLHSPKVNRDGARVGFAGHAHVPECGKNPCSRVRFSTCLENPVVTVRRSSSWIQTASQGIRGARPENELMPVGHRSKRHQSWASRDVRFHFSWLSTMDAPAGVALRSQIRDDPVARALNRHPTGAQTRLMSSTGRAQVESEMKKLICWSSM